MSKILNRIGTSLLILAGFIRFAQGKLEPSYTLALIGAILIALAQWRRV